MLTQADKGSAFHALHEREGAFIIPNPWDIGTAKLLTQLGFEALATTSAGYAFSVGKRDGTIGRDETIRHVAAIVSATDLPVSGDLENGFGDAPESVTKTIRLAAEAGLVGGSIEDVPRHQNSAPYELERAAERVRAAAEVVRNLPFRFTLTARAENYLVGRPDLNDTIMRLQAYQEAGADVLYAPGLATENDIVEVVRSVNRPVNILVGLRDMPFTLSALSAIGVKRVSVGSALARAALGAFFRGVQEMNGRGSFEFAEGAVPYPDVNAMFGALTSAA